MTRRELLEELLVESLSLANAYYGCVLEFTPQLLACIIRDEDGTTHRCSDSSLQRQDADRVMKSVRDASKATFSNQGFNETPCLPKEHPVIESFAMLPIRQDGRIDSVLIIANSAERFDLLIINRLQALINDFVDLQLNAIITRGMNSVIADVGRINRQMVTLVSASINGVLTIDDKAIITAFNPACERMFDIGVRQALGSNIESLLSKSMLKTVIASAASYKKSITPHDSEALMVASFRLI